MSKAFLFVCAFLAAFISLSGLSTVRSLSDLPAHLAFLPVTLYLLFTAFRQLIHMRHAPDVVLSGRNLQLTILGLIFLTLVVLGYKAARAPQKTPAASSANPLILLPASPTPTTPSSDPILTVTYPDPSVLVNIRSQPATSSALLLKTPVGSSFPVTDLLNGWYQVSLPSSAAGWIYQDYASISGLLP